MKKFGKILAVLLSLVLAVTALVVIGAADDAKSEKSFVVEGVTGEDGLGGYDVLADAMTAANGEKTIKLNKDYTLEKYVVVNGKNAILDLNGHVFTANDVFAINDGWTLTITGNGTIKVANTIATVNAGGTLVLDGDITVEQTQLSNNPVFNLQAANANAKLVGKLTVKPHSLGFARLFGIGIKSATSPATLTLDGATVIVTEPTTGTRLSSAGGMTFGYLNDGANVVIKNSTVTMEHGDFLRASSYTAGTVLDTGLTDTSIDAATLDGLTLPAGDNMKIDIKGSKISALNSGYSKFLTNWGNSTPGGYLFDLGTAAVTVNVEDTDLVGTNRTISLGGSESNASKIYPAYFTFTNVNFTSPAFTTYTDCRLFSGNFNAKWNGGTITLLAGAQKCEVALGTDVDYSSDPFGTEAFAAAQAKGYTGSYDDFKQLFYAKEGRVLTGSVQTENNYWSFGSTSSNSFSILGFRYSESTDGTKWCGTLFKNVCITDTDKMWDTAATYSTAGTRYTNVKYIKNGEIKTYPVAYLDEAPTLIASNTDTLDTANGYYYAQNGSGGEETSGTTALFGDIFEANGNKNKWWGRYSEVKGSNGNGYVRLDKYKVASDLSGANVYTGLNYGKWNLYVKNYNYLVHEFDIATESGTFYRLVGSFLTRGSTRTEVKVDADGDKYINKSSLSGPWSYQIFNLQTDGDLFNDDSVILPNDGSWTRITVVYEMKAELIEVYTDSEKTGTTSLYDYTGSKAHIYVDGAYAKSVNIFNYIYMTEEENDKFFVDQLRCNQYNEEGTTCFDNNRVSAYSATQATKALTAISANASTVKLNDYKSDFLVMPKASNIEMATANVSWVIGDKTVGTSTPLAGSTVSDVAPEAIVLKQANELRNELNNGWYDYGFSGWKVTDAEDNELTSTDTLAENATYTFTAVCDKPIAPEKGVSGIKINLSLRLNFDLNFYVPVPNEELNVSNVMISNGSTKLNAGTNDAGTVVYGTEVTIYGDLYTKHRDIYGVAELTSETYTLSYTVGTTVITQDIVYGVSDYVGQYMSTSKDDGNTVPRTLVMQMVNYAVKVVKHEDSGVTVTDEINEVITKYEALLTKYPELLTTTEKSYFTTDASVLAKIESSKKSVFGTDADGNVNTTAPDNKVAYYLESPALYFSTGTPKFIFKYTDAALAQGIKNPNGNEMTDYGAKPGIFAYTGYNSKATQGKHLAYAGGIGSGTKQSNSDAVWGDNTKTDGSVTYYVTMLDDTFRGNSFAVYELLRNIQIDVNLTCYDSDASQYKTTGKASGKYCLEWYINGIIEGGAVDADVELAIALYDYAKVAYEYVMGTAYVPTTV